MQYVRVKLVVAIFVLASVYGGAAQVPRAEIERQLATRFGFTQAEIAQVRSGQAVAKLLPTNAGTDIGVYGAVRIEAKADRLVNWFRDIANFRKAAELGVSRRLNDPPQIGDFADLSLNASELAALKTCRPGKCDLRLGDRAIQRFQTEVNWTASDAAVRANLLMRQLLLAYTQAYLKGGDQALGASHNEKAPKVFADEFRQVLWQSKALYDIAAPLATYLEQFPAATLPRAEQFLYWAKSDVTGEAMTSLHHLVVYHGPSGAAFIADKQLYASRYTDAALALISLAPEPDGSSFHALVGARARSTMLTGVGARMLRGRVEAATRDTAKMYLDWIRASMAN
jgi:hypothetical protein